MVERFIESLTAQGHTVEMSGADRTSAIYVDGVLYGHIIADRIYAV